MYLKPSLGSQNPKTEKDCDGQCLFHSPRCNGHEEVPMCIKKLHLRGAWKKGQMSFLQRSNWAYSRQGGFLRLQDVGRRVLVWSKQQKPGRGAWKDTYWGCDRGRERHAAPWKITEASKLAGTPHKDTFRFWEAYKKSLILPSLIVTFYNRTRVYFPRKPVCKSLLVLPRAKSECISN